MRKRLAFLLVFALVFGMFSGFGMTKVEAKDSKPQETLDIGIKLREQQNDPDFIREAEEIIRENAAKIDFSEDDETNSEADVTSTSPEIGTEKYFLGINLEFIKFTLRSVGDNVEVWVANDLSYGYERDPDVVTQEQIDKIRDEFENTIYPTDTGFFGDEDFHDGSNMTIGGVPEDYYYSETGKKIILVENIKDDSYYEPTRTFVAGFYWGTIENYIDRNIITIDTNSWSTRLEETYYGVVAHEFQHLLHDDNDPAEANWINEGMSDFAQYLCGYGHNWGHVEEFLMWPENSLLLWGDYNEAEILADYGQAYLMQLYLYDQYGKDFVRALATDGEDQSIESANKILDEFNTGIDFEELFRRFTIACAIDQEKWQGGIYGFDSIDVQIDFESANDNTDTHYVDSVPAWGADYKILEEDEKIETISFDGIDFLPMPWKVEDGVLWGNAGHGLDNFLIFEADLTNVNTATLEFDHLMDIEEEWDFGFVQVSTDDGQSWISLSNENTTSDFLNWDEFPQIGEQLPGFTGYSNGEFIHEIFDLSQYAGENIHIAFRYMTDGAYNDTGWFIDNISIPEIGYSNDCSSTDDFMTLSQLTETYVEYTVAFINEQAIGKDKAKYKVVNVDPFNITEEDALELRQLLKDGNNYMVVWYASNGEQDYVPFTYDILLKSEVTKGKGK